MDDLGFDRLVKGLAASSGRRQTVLASLGGLFAAVVASGADDAEAKKKKKKKKKNKKNKNEVLPPPPPPPQSPPPPPIPPPACTNLAGSCTASGQCCGNDVGVVACRLHIKAECLAQLPGQRCCGLENVVCNPNNGDCDCCDDLVCRDGGDKFRCESAEI